jgi:hypothetical protein
MTYRGHMQNGVAVLEGDVRPPDGTPVEVVPIEAPAAAAEKPIEEDSFYRVYELAEPSGIPDLSVNIDHYLYGHPKVSDERA